MEVNDMFEPSAMGTNFMFGVNNYVPLTTNNFEIRIYDINADTMAESSKLLTLSTAEVGAVAEQQDTIIVHYGNGLIKFPSKVTFEEVTWTLNCFCQPNVLGLLREWRRSVYDPDTERMGLPSEYMKDVYFIKYDGQGNTRDVIKCPGTWIGALNNGDMNQEGGQVVRVTVPFIISRVIYMKPEEVTVG